MEPSLQFEWDPQKAAFNESKHGVTFAQAERVIYDPFASEEIDGSTDYGEERLITVGMVGLEMIVVV